MEKRVDRVGATCGPGLTSITPHLVHFSPSNPILKSLHYVDFVTVPYTWAMAKHNRDLGAPQNNILSKAGYATLLEDLRTELEAGKARAQQAMAQVLVDTYWKAGQRVLGEALSERAGYGAGIIEELALDLGLSRALMFRIVSFAKAYPDQPQPGLGWSHYVALLGVKTDAARAHYEQLARGQKLSFAKLKREIASDSFSRTQLEADNPANHHRAGQSAPSAPDSSDPTSAREPRPKLERPSDGSHLYAATVSRVIDGDTLIVDIDLGFNVIRRQKMRLADIDTAESGTNLGRLASHFVRERLANAESVAIKTVRTEDRHGRYVGHLFYTTASASAGEAFAQGVHLNGELVIRGLASLAPNQN